MLLILLEADSPYLHVQAVALITVHNLVRRLILLILLKGDSPYLLTPAVVAVAQGLAHWPILLLHALLMTAASRLELHLAGPSRPKGQAISTCPSQISALMCCSAGRHAWHLPEAAVGHFSSSVSACMGGDVQVVGAGSVGCA